MKAYLALPLLLLLVLVPAPVAASEEVPLEDPHAGDLFEDEFNTLGLFGRIQRLRPRLRLTQNMVIDQRYPGAEVDSFELGFRASVAAPITDSLAVRLTGRMESTLHHFSGDRDFLDTGRTSGDPFDELLSNSFRLEGRYSLWEDWALVGGVSYRSSWERGSSYREGIKLDGFFGVAHIFRDTISIILAAQVGSGLNGSNSWSPIIRIGWRITKNIEIETQELGLKLAVRVHPKVTLFLSGRRSSNSYKLEDRGGRVGKGKLRDRRIPILFGARWKITKRWRVRGSVGAIVDQKYVVRDHNGNLFDEEGSTGPAFTGRLYLEYRF